VNATLEEEKTESLARYRVNALLSQAQRVNVPIGGLAAFIGALVWNPVPTTWIVGWVACVYAALVFRTQGLKAILQADGRVQVRRAIIYSGINGLVQGAPAWLFMPSLGLESRTVLTMILMLQCTSAISTSSFYLPAFRIYSALIALPVAFEWARWGTDRTPEGALSIEPTVAGLALLIVVYTFVQEGFARRSQEIFIESFDIRFRNEQLLRELRQERAALAVERDRAEGASRAKSRFLAAASHDLRQPMHTMSLLSAALMLSELPATARETAEKMEEAIGVLSSLLDGLLDISKLDAGIVTVRREPTLLAPLLERLRQDYSLLARNKGLAVTVVCESGLAVVTDRQLLERILRNLIDNAVKYTEEGGITVEARVRDGRARLSVVDSGAGIPDDEKERVFEEFYQLANPQRDRERGLGLGLAIVRRLCRLLSIGVTLHSMPGRGTRVDLEIELAGEAGAAVPEESPAGTTVAGLRVLLVDDEVAVRDSTRLFLEAVGCRVTSAENVAEALRAADEEPVDIVVADYRLGDGENGVDLIRALRARHPRLAAILVSGDTAPERLREANAEGVKMLHKPVGRETFCRAIEVAMREGPAS
jgi:signal transduction histidine kinase